MDPLRPGDPQRIGPYVLRGRLGAGGMGEVFFGHSPGGRPVAVKLIHPVFVADPDFRRRFRLEVEAARKVGGFHTAQVVDAQPDADRPWLVTAYVAGPSLAQVIASHGGLPVRSVRVLGAGLAEALQAIHAAGLIHRDLKPSNILLADDGPRVIDFGIARAMDASGITALVGTPGFMAPEVLTGESLTPACDVFALGMVLAFASGVRPFGEGPSEAVSYRVVHEQPNLTSLDPGVREIIAVCLAKVPADRPGPGQLVRQLASPEPVTAWLPESVGGMTPAGEAGYQPTLVGGPDPARAARLLDEAEQLARAIPSALQRARALVHIAGVVARIDAAHGARLVDDALHSPFAAWIASVVRTNPVGPGGAPVIDVLARIAVGDIGPVLARLDAEPARRLIADIEAIGTVADYRSRARLAEGMAAVDADWAVRFARGARDAEGRAAALAAVVSVLARSDITRAAQVAAAIRDLAQHQPAFDQLYQARMPGKRWRRASSVSEEAAPPPKVARFQALALANIAVIAAGGRPAQSMSFTAAATQFAATATANPAAGLLSADAGQAERLLAEAERVASDLPRASDERAWVLAQVKCAAAQVRPDRSGQFLGEAEQHARAIADEHKRMKGLAYVAVAAASIDPPLAALISGSIQSAHKHSVALALAKTDPERATQLAVRTGDKYLIAIVKAMVTMATERVRPIQALQEAAATARSLSEVVQAAVLAVPIDPDWAEKLLHPADLNGWRKRFEAWNVADRSGVSRRPLNGGIILQWQGFLECEQANGLADLANAFLGDRADQD